MLNSHVAASATKHELAAEFVDERWTVETHVTWRHVTFAERSAAAENGAAAAVKYVEYVCVCVCV